MNRSINQSIRFSFFNFALLGVKNKGAAMLVQKGGGDVNPGA